jgi:hypothetical protein
MSNKGTGTVGKNTTLNSGKFEQLTNISYIN